MSYRPLRGPVVLFAALQQTAPSRQTLTGGHTCAILWQVLSAVPGIEGGPGKA